MTPQERAAELVTVELDEPYAMYEVILCERVIGHRYHSRERAEKDAAEVVSRLAAAIEAAIADAVRLKDPADAPVSEEELRDARERNTDQKAHGIAPGRMLDHIDWQAGLITMLMRDEPGVAYLEGVEDGRRAERESCAKTVEEHRSTGSFSHLLAIHGGELAEVIRAR